MATYLIVNLIVVAAVVGVLVWLKGFVFSKPILAALIVLLLTTAVFDSLIIDAGIVAYDSAKLIGVYVGSAPIEDFFYAVLAGLLIPAVWRLTNKEELHEE